MFSRSIILLSPKMISNMNTVYKVSNFKNINNIGSLDYSLKNIKITERQYNTESSAKVPEEQFKEIPMTTLKEFKSRYSPAMKYIAPKLQELLDLTLNEAKDLIKKYPKLKKISCDTLETNYNMYTEAGLKNEIIHQYPLILTLDYIKLKIGYMQQLDVDINLITPLLFANINDLKKIVQYLKMEQNSVPYKNRIVYLSNILNLSAPEISEKIINHYYVLKIPIDRLDMILKVLLDYGVEPRNILNDWWALRYSPQIAEERLQRAIKANVSKVKTWMIRCQDKTFERCINRQIENRTVLGDHSSVEEYLSKRLECSIDNAKYLTEKYPALAKMNISKMKEILDFLYEQGYSPANVCRVPRIMVHSLETTKQRIQQLKQLGYVPPSVAILCKSKRDFNKILQKYNKRKKSNDDGIINEK